MKNLFDIIPSNLSSALGWTLIHALWQGIAIVLLFSVLRSVFKPSNTRYWLGMGALSLQLSAAIITFFIIYEPTQTLGYLADNQTFTGFSAQTSNFAFTPQKLSLVQQIEFFLQNNLDLFVTVWLIGTSFLLLRLVVGFAYVQGLKVQKTNSVNADIQALMNSLLEKVQFSKKIKLLESARATVPMTIGWLKPVILLPVGIATGLTVRQLEAILAHELAHIKRYDYFVNIFQNIIEILFFFHPATWFISAKVRDERENCCDDFAVKICGDRMVLAHALTQVASYQQQPRLAMAFGAKRQNFMDRIKRIIGINTSQSNRYGNFSAVLGIILVVALGGVVAQKWGKIDTLGRREYFDVIKTGKMTVDVELKKSKTEKNINKVSNTLKSQATPPKVVKVQVSKAYFNLTRALIADSKGTKSVYTKPLIFDNKGTCSIYIITQKNGKNIAKALPATISTGEEWTAQGLKAGDLIVIESKEKLKNGDEVSISGLPKIGQIWQTPQQRSEAVMGNADAEFERNAEGRDTPIYENPLLLNGQPLDYGTFSIKSKGVLTLMKGKPTSTDAVKIPFRIYLRRNGIVIYEKKSATKLTQIEISEVLALSKVGDQIIINPTEKVDYKAKRIINVLF